MKGLKEFTIELNKDVLATLTELDKDKVYIFQVECGKMSAEETFDYLKNFKKCADNVELKCLIIPTHNGQGAITITELEKYMKNGSKKEV